MASAMESSDDDDFVSLADIVSSQTLSASPGPSMTPQSNSQNTIPSEAGAEDGSDSEGRRVRRGLDFRRPVLATAAAARNSAPVIDLTSDNSDNEMPRQVRPSSRRSSRRPSISGRQAQRLPRFAREIIDIEDDDDGPAVVVEARNAGASRSRSPEIQMLGTRQLPNRNTQSRQLTPTLRRQDAQDVTFLETRRLPSVPPRGARMRRLPTPHAVAARRTHGQAARLERALDRFTGLQDDLLGLAEMGHRGLQEVLGQIGNGMNFGRGGGGGLDINLNYENQGFALGGFMGEIHHEPPVERYAPPEPAGEGFTRSPQEDEMLVCPNCGEELGEGKTEQKRQIWVVKKCGHVYCGECHGSRSVSAKKKGKAAATNKPAFSTCVVEGCGGKVGSKTAMFQIYL